MTPATSRAPSHSLSAAAGLAALLALGAVACAGEDSSPASELLALDDQYSENGRLLVYTDAEGRLGLGVYGKIGVDDELLGGRAINQATLADTYRMLHPDARVVPAHVAELSDRLAVQRAAALAEAAAAPVPPEAPVEDKDFLSQACQSFVEGSTNKWVPRYCPYKVDGNQSVRTNYTIGPGDRSLVWNQCSVRNNHAMSSATTGLYSPVRSVQEWTWGWNEWPVVGEQNRASLSAPHINCPVLGVTWHNYEPIVR